MANREHLLLQATTGIGKTVAALFPALKYALAHDKIDTGNLQFRHELQDIETLNRRALRGELEVTAVSIHAYAYLLDKYSKKTGPFIACPNKECDYRREAPQAQSA